MSAIDGSAINLRVLAACSPAPIWFSGHPHIIGMMMPMRHTDEMKREAPQWARRGPEREQSDIEDRLRVVPMKA